MSLTKVTYAMIGGISANVLDFGADATGATDSTAAFTAALAASQSIYVPEGTYIVDTITLPLGYGSGIVIKGANRETTILQAKNADSPIFNSAGTFSANNLISEFTLQANAAGSTGPAVDMRNISFSTFESINIIGNGSGAWTNGFHFYAYDVPPFYGHCYKNVINGVYVSTSCISNAVFLFENYPNANAISNVFVGTHLSGPLTSIPYVVQCTSPNGGYVKNLIFEKFLVECEITQYAFDFGDNAACLVLKDSWSEITTGQTFNSTNTSRVNIENFQVNGASYSTLLPLNFTIINFSIGGVTAGQAANQLGPAQSILFTSSPISQADPRALDEYLEGTWDPVARGTTTAGTTTHVVAPRGYFIKIGKLVYVEFSFIGTTLSGATGNLQVTGLPYLPDNGTLFFSSANWNFGNIDLLAASSTSTLTGVTGPAQSSIALNLCNNSTSAAIPVGDIKGTFYFSGNATYVAGF